MDVSGQKTYNGVAMLSKTPIEVELTALPGDAKDEQARYIEALVTPQGDTQSGDTQSGDTQSGGTQSGGTPVRVASIYLPNGNPTRNDDGRDSEKYLYKLAWMERLIAHAQSLLKTGDAFVLGGDYNICPTDDDVHDPAGFADDALCRPESRARFRRLMHLGLTVALRAFNAQPHLYSYWDYQRGARAKDTGLQEAHSDD